MEITPEERDRIYQEQKKRLGGRGKQTLTPLPRKRRWLKWVFLAFWAFFLFVFVMALLNARQKRTPTPMSPEQVEAQMAH